MLFYANKNITDRSNNVSKVSFDTADFIYEWEVFHFPLQHKEELTFSRYLTVVEYIYIQMSSLYPKEIIKFPSFTTPFLHPSVEDY
jgi:hypothetical protein